MLRAVRAVIRQVRVLDALHLAQFLRCGFRLRRRADHKQRLPLRTRFPGQRPADGDPDAAAKEKVRVIPRKIVPVARRLHRVVHRQAQVLRRIQNRAVHVKNSCFNQCNPLRL